MSSGAYLIYFAVLLILLLWAQAKVRGAYSKYSKVPTSTQLTGVEVARKILDDNGLYDVSIEQTRGVLSDHYDPRQKVVRLSPDIYNGRSMAAAAVAAHEVGHAIQDAESYAFLRFRSALVPVASLGSGISFVLILVELFLNMANLIIFVIIFMAEVVLFQLVTLPVEFNASSRAMDQLIVTGIIRNEEERDTKKVLDAAALTYVAAALVAVLELMRFILIFMSND